MLADSRVSSVISLVIWYSSGFNSLHSTTLWFSACAPHNKVLLCVTSLLVWLVTFQHFRICDRPKTEWHRTTLCVPCFITSQGGNINHKSPFYLGDYDNSKFLIRDCGWQWRFLCKFVQLCVLQICESNNIVTFCTGINSKKKFIWILTIWP